MIRNTTPNCFGLAAALLFSALVTGAPAARAAGDEPVAVPPAGTPKNGATTATGKPVDAKSDLTTCAKGMVWDAKNHKCMVKQSGVLPDAELTSYAYALAKADRYDEALDILNILKDRNTPRALNYRGYATRKLGRTEEGIGYYLKAVAMDPAYVQVREYLGEAYVVLGKFDQAFDQLATIQKLCGGTDCEEYEDLAAAIAKAKGM